MNLEVTLSSSVDGPLSERVVDNNVVVVVCISWILQGMWFNDIAVVVVGGAHCSLWTLNEMNELLLLPMLYFL